MFRGALPVPAMRDSRGVAAWASSTWPNASTRRHVGARGRFFAPAQNRHWFGLADREGSPYLDTWLVNLTYDGGKMKAALCTWAPGQGG